MQPIQPEPLIVEDGGGSTVVWPALLRMGPERHLRRVLPGFLSTPDEVHHYVSDATSALSKAGLIAVTKAAVEAFLQEHIPNEVSL
jgi:hypothetical protein